MDPSLKTDWPLPVTDLSTRDADKRLSRKTPRNKIMNCRHCNSFLKDSFLNLGLLRPPMPI